ncbi:MAG TPA: hypothetical protein VD968_03455 [Pyrinomonadaceae bacterium]|nr:hypothetical protein [Pyrinomonadaceae bacterium]
MKNTVRVLTLIALAATFSLPALAQDAAATQSTASQTEEEQRSAKYAEFLKLYKGTPEQQKQAADIGREYVAKYGSNTADENNAQIVKFIQGWLARYDKAVRDYEFDQAVRNNQVPRAFELGRQVGAAEPDNVTVQLRLALLGLNAAAAKNEANNADTIQAAKRALQLVESGKTPDKDNWAPFPNRDEAIGALNFTLGWLLLKTDPVTASNHLVKVAQSNTRFKKDPTTYYSLGSAYYNSPEFQRMLTEYNEKYAGKEPVPEGVALLDKINHVLDRVIDAYARAVAATTDATQKAAFMKALTAVYKARYDKEDGVQELVNTVASRPLPLLSDPVKMTPPPTTPATGTTTTPSGSATSGATTTTPASTNGTKPATPPKPKR